MCLGFRVYGFRVACVSGLGLHAFRVWYRGLMDMCGGLRVCGLGVMCLGFRVSWIYGSWAWGV